jgi:hypothetical protein
MADAVIACPKPRERGNDILEHVRLHLHECEVEVFLQRISRHVVSWPRRLGAGRVAERTNLLLHMIFERPAARFEHLFQFIPA